MIPRYETNLDKSTPESIVYYCKLFPQTRKFWNHVHHIINGMFRAKIVDFNHRDQIGKRRGEYIIL